MVEMLVKEKANDLLINARDCAGRSVLHYACRKGSVDLVKVILTCNGVDTEARTRGGETPLMHACQSG